VKQHVPEEAAAMVVEEAGFGARCRAGCESDRRGSDGDQGLVHGRLLVAAAGGVGVHLAIIMQGTGDARCSS